MPTRLLAIILVLGATLSCGDDDGFTRPRPILSVAADGSGEYPTIQAALDAARTGAVIELGHGVFAGDGNRDISFQGKAVTVRSGSANPYTCIIDCGADSLDPHRAFLFDSGEGASSVLEGVFVTGGYLPYDIDVVQHSQGGAIHCRNGSSPTIRNCVFADNYAHSKGGAVYAYRSSPTISDCSFSSNRVHGSGGALGWSRATATLRRCTFTRNSAGSISGAVHLTAVAADIEDCVFEENEAPRAGAVTASAVSGELHRCQFWANSSERDAGALLITGDAVLSHCTFAWNTADAEDWSFGGGAVLCMGESNITFRNCTFALNGTANGGGTIACWGDWWPDRVTPRAFFENCIIAFSAAGPAVYAHQDIQITSRAELTCSNVFGNAGGDWVGYIEGQADQSGNISADPLFCSPLDDQLTIHHESPCAPRDSSGCGLMGAWPVGCLGSR